MDGTKIKAVNSQDKNFTRAALIKAIKQADERLVGYFKQMDDDDDGEDIESTSSRPKNLAEKIARLKTKRDRHLALLGDLELSGDKQISHK